MFRNQIIGYNSFNTKGDKRRTDCTQAAVRYLCRQGDAAYVAKYRSQFIDAFGEEWMLIKDKMEKKKKK